MTPKLKPYHVQNNEQSLQTLEKLLLEIEPDGYSICKPNRYGHIQMLILKNGERVMVLVCDRDAEYQALGLIKKAKESALTLHEDKCNVITKENN